MAENPFMSAYLSAANRVAKTARGKATNEARIETAGDKHDQRLAERRAARTGSGWLPWPGAGGPPAAGAPCRDRALVPSGSIGSCISRALRTADCPDVGSD